MAFQIHQTSGLTKMIIIGEFVVVSYLLYTLTVSVYKSYQIDQHILNFKQENERIADENLQRESDFNYYSSDSYIEKIAKQNLGLINPGEEVIVVPSSLFSASSDSGTNLNSSGGRVQNQNNPQKWWSFFFDNSADKK